MLCHHEMVALWTRPMHQHYITYFIPHVVLAKKRQNDSA
jgi:hypothetical protein